MADTTIQSLTRNTAKEITEASGAASQTVPMSGYPDDMFLYVRNTDATTARVRVSAPTDGNRAALTSALGDLYQDVAQNEVFILGPLDGARFKDLGEDITVLITGTDDGAFGGTVGNVKIASIMGAR
jgi:hypothetical protein